MKSIATLCLLTLISFFLSAQSAPYSETIEAGNIQASFCADGMLFWDYNPARPFYRVPKTDSVHSLFAGSIWIAGLDNGGTIKAATKMYTANKDYRPGPYNPDSAVARTLSQDWNFIWKIDKATINCFRADFLDNGILEAGIPASILHWPAFGNVNAEAAGVALVPPINAAPFVDVNSNGIYDPANGDYPEIKGDQMLWFCYNDGHRYGLSGDKAMNLEVHTSIWAYNCPSDSVFYNTVFSSFKVVNRSAITYTDIYVGHFFDSDLGCFNDDYVGTDTVSDAVFSYNADAFDESCASPGYGSEIPIQSMHMLNHHMTNSMMFYNDNSMIGNPVTENDYYGYLQSIWKNGYPLEYGGDGYNEGTYPYNYYLPTMPNVLPGWSACAASMPESDVRILSSTGPFSLAAGAGLRFDFAYLTTFLPVGSYPCPDVSSMQAGGLYLQDNYATQNFICYNNSIDCDSSLLALATPSLSELGVNIYPNPTTDFLMIDLPSEGQYAVRVYNTMGQLVLSENELLKSNEQLDISHLPSGSYHVVVQLEEGSGHAQFVKLNN